MSEERKKLKCFFGNEGLQTSNTDKIKQIKTQNMAQTQFTAKIELSRALEKQIWSRPARGRAAAWRGAGAAAEDESALERGTQLLPTGRLSGES